MMPVARPLSPPLEGPYLRAWSHERERHIPTARRNREARARSRSSRTSTHHRSGAGAGGAARGGWTGAVCLLLLVLTSATPLHAQSQRQLYPTLTGAALLRQLEDDFTPRGPLDYGTARDTLFRRVWATDRDSLVGQYTGYAIHLPPGLDPTDEAFRRDINTEHLYPQSKGAETGDGRADMHHLYPTRVDVNSDRGSLAFGDIPDAQTLRWYRRGEKRTTPPPAAIRDEYSEGTGQRFEPREARKGDIARAMFYFWTIHRAAAQAADPNFFAIQAPTLCAWHASDPVDADEAERSRRIARYQGNENPFVLDCTLADRLAYCPTRSAACDRLVPAGEAAGAAAGLRLRVYPTPAREFLSVEGIPSGATLTLYDAWGRRVRTWSPEVLPPGGPSASRLDWSWSSGELAPGLYLLDAGPLAGAVRVLVQ